MNMSLAPKNIHNARKRELYIRTQISVKTKTFPIPTSNETIFIPKTQRNSDFWKIAGAHLGRPLLSSFCHSFLVGNDIHLVDFHDTHLIDIWLFQNRIPAIVDPLIIRPELRFDKTNASESTLQAWPWLPFRMFSPEYFCPNHQRFAPKISNISETGVLLAAPPARTSMNESEEQKLEGLNVRALRCVCNKRVPLHGDDYCLTLSRCPIIAFKTLPY